LTREDPKRPGRPRDERAETAILDAALELFIEKGLEGLTIEAIADEACVGKTTIYRRWDSKEELVAAALDRKFATLEIPDLGDVVEELQSVLATVRSFMSSSLAGKILPRMMGEVAAGSPLGKLYMKKVIAPRRGLLVGLIQRGIDRGQLVADTDPDLLVDGIMGTTIFLRLSAPGRFADNAAARAMIDHIVRPYRAG
jgi:AcrR family transcriptional regulator